MRQAWSADVGRGLGLVRHGMAGVAWIGARLGEVRQGRCGEQPRLVCSQRRKILIQVGCVHNKHNPVMSPISISFCGSPLRAKLRDLVRVLRGVTRHRTGFLAPPDGSGRCSRRVTTALPTRASIQEHENPADSVSSRMAGVPVIF
jgi:hypothetical protein